MARPLDGIRVLDLSRVVSGPICCWYLASLGAEVIRVEVPGGDVTWRNPPHVSPTGQAHTGPRGERDISISALRKGRGKRSIELDLSCHEGLATLLALVDRSDVLVENFKPGVLARFGLTWPELHARNPRLVMASISGYGPDGPYRDRAAMDVVVQAVSGLMAKTGQPDGPPTKVGAAIGDLIPSGLTALGVVAALRQRDVTGLGQLVDVAMLDALLTVMWDEPLDHYEDTGVPVRFGNGDPRGSPFGVYRTRDGWVAISAAADNHWQALATEIAGPELARRWPGHMDRVHARGEVEGVVADWCAARTSAEVTEVCVRLELPGGPVNEPGFARRDPHVAHRGSLERLRHADTGAASPYLGAAFPVRLSDADTSTGPAEPLGASTEAVLADVLGYDAAAIAALRAAGALGPERRAAGALGPERRAAGALGPERRAAPPEAGR